MRKEEGSWTAGEGLSVSGENEVNKLNYSHFSTAARGLLAPHRLVRWHSKKEAEYKGMRHGQLPLTSRHHLGKEKRCLERELNFELSL